MPNAASSAAAGAAATTRRRIAFLTREFPTEAERGGLASYLERMTFSLRDAGHEPEVFVLSGEAPGVLEHAGVRVERVRRADRHAAVRVLGRALPWLGQSRLLPALHIVSGALALARALDRRAAERAFDAVQSADYRAPGLCVRRQPGRPHLVRCSSASDLTARADGDRSLARWLEAWLERAAIRHADVAYAPSRFVASHLAERIGRELAVLRPPAFLETKPALRAPQGLPPRFLLHVGKPGALKGTQLLAAALPKLWAQEPSFTLAFAGAGRGALHARFGELWGAQAARVVALGTLAKPDLYAALAGAEAAVLPSLADNLPNAAIESLLLGTPVVAFDGASLDELVEPGVTGELVPSGDEDALVAALLRVWRGQSRARKGFVWRAAIAQEMRPDCAVQNLLALAGLAERA
jgi:glycosyltransferase involved in cell wall biosynthesis